MGCQFANPGDSTGPRGELSWTGWVRASLGPLVLFAALAVGLSGCGSAPGVSTGPPPVTPPSITSLKPSSGPVGTSVTIAGTNFGATQGSSTITFSGTVATPTSWSATSIVAPVPSGATTGNVLVTVGGQESNGVSFTVTAAVAAAYPLKASSNGRYLVDQNNAPFLMVGDGPHALITNVSVADATTYMADRAAHGVNVLWVELLSNSYVGGPASGCTLDGICPFTGTINNGAQVDITTPNPAYFARVDQLINIAASHGMAILLDSLETGGWMTTFEQNGNTAANTWGQYIGNRYKSFPNIIWILGNDFQTWNSSATDNTLAQNVMAGIAATDKNHLQTTELDYNISGSLDDSLLAPYVTITGAYTYYPVYYEVLQEYNSPATVPVFLEETYYEGVTYGLTPPTATDLMLRKAAYWTVTSGGLAGYMGGTQYYDFHTGWQTGIDTISQTQLKYWGSFITSLAWYKLVPDQTHTVVTAGLGTASGNGSGNIQTDNYVTAASAADGSLVVAYCPASTTITVDMTKLSGAAMAQWYDPTSNTYQAISGSPFANTGTHNFPTPGHNSEGDPDWVLVLQVNP
jgi:uncharacterized protein DUF4038/IPT/TIG domain-containing protein/collagenase-like protein with putative collagen-binding domain